jgi:hypothetical protein
VRRATLLGLTCLALGCERDPVWFGYWELVEGRRDGVAQRDLGTVEVMRDGSVATFLRYEWTGAEFVPDPNPTVDLGTAGVSEQDDFFDGYKEKGETYTLYLSQFSDITRPLSVVEYTGATALLSGTQCPWPGSPPEELLPIELHLER